MAATAHPSAWVHPTGPTGTQPSSPLIPGVLISAAIAASDPRTVATTRGLRDSSRVRPGWAPTSATSATSATVDARGFEPVPLAIAHAAVAAAAVVAPRAATACSSTDS
ncbi:hypothetical protein ACWPOB_20940 [Rhodococcus sp. 2H158]